MGDEIPTHDRDGNATQGRSFLLLFNAHHEPLAFTQRFGLRGHVGDSYRERRRGGLPTHRRPRDRIQMNSRSLLILRRD